MRSSIGILAAGFFVFAAVGVRAEGRALNGAGATFPFPIYSKWFDEYHKASGVRINYQSIGSGGGIRQIAKKTVDFGATDSPMTAEQTAEIKEKILHVPTVIGAVVVAFNLKDAAGADIKELRLSGPIVADIFLGKITRWNDPSIQALNAGLKLPSSPITVIRRADGSGTTYAFVDYLAKVSPEWKKAVGVNTAVKWPTGLGAKGNEGVSGLLMQSPGSIGYVEAIYARQNGLASAAIKNRAGTFVKATVESVSAAAAGSAALTKKDDRASIVDAAGKNSYPISTYTWLLIYEKSSSGKEIRDFLKWMLASGQPMAADLGYSPLPEPVKSLVAAKIASIR